MMKNDLTYPSGWKLFASLLLMFTLLFQAGFAQKYSKMRITLDQGVVLEGKKGTINQESAVMTIDGQQQSFPLSDIQNVMAKKGMAWQWAACFGGGCLVVGLATTAVNPNNDDVGTLLLGSAIWTGIFAGVGGLIGLALDPWKNVYVPKKSAFLQNLNLELDLDYRGNPMVGVSYRF